MLLGPGPLWAQACEQINLVTTAQQRALLQDYVVDCYQRHFFFEDKGAVKLIAYQDAGGRPCWLLSAIVDDRYRAASPAQYAHFDNNVILVYKGDSRGNALPPAGSSAERAACHSEVLGAAFTTTPMSPSIRLTRMRRAAPRKSKSRTSLAVTYTTT